MNDYIRYIAETYDYQKDSAYRINATAKLNQRGVQGVEADVEKMEEVYERTGSESPRRYNR